MKRFLKFFPCLALFWSITSASAQPTNPSIGSVKWFLPTDAHVQSVVLGTNGLAFASTWDEVVIAFDVATREIRWRTNFPGTRYGGGLVIAPDNTLLVGSVLFRAVDADTGQVKWSRDFSYGNSYVAVSPNGTVFVVADSLYALDLVTGEEKWSFHRNDISGAPALSADGFVYVSTQEGGVMAFDAVTGERHWTFHHGARSFTSPTIGPDGTVYACTDYDVYSLDRTTGRTNWVVETSGISIRPIIGGDGTIYVGTWEGIVSAHASTNGARLWQTNLPSYLECMTLAADGTLFVSVPNAFFSVNSTNGATNALFATGARFSDINLAPDGTILLPSWGSNGVFALHGTSPLAPTAWPKAFQNSQNSSHWQVAGPPQITHQPGSQWLAHESNAALRFYSPAVRPLQVQWYFNGSPIPQGTNEVLRLNNVQFTHAGHYSVVISNKFGAAVSDDAEVFVGYGLTVRTFGPGGVERDLYQGAYQTNSTVHLTAVPATNRNFVGWSGAITSTAPVLDVLMSSNVILTATFEFWPGDILWEMPKSFGSTPAISTNGILYGAYWLGYAIAADARTGEILWNVSVNGEVNISPSIGHDGTVFVGTYGSTVNALDGQTGAHKWGFNINVCVHSCPAIGVDGTAYFAGDKVYAVDVATGAEKWSFETNGIFEASPAIGADNTVYIGSWNGSMYAFDGSTGRKKWEFPTGGFISSSPALGYDGTVYFSSRDGKIYALDGQTGASRWEFDTGAEANGSPIIGPNGIIYTSSYDRMFALNGLTGSNVWVYQAENYVSDAAALAADGTLVFAFSTQNNATVLCAVNAADGEEKWRVSFDVGELRSPSIGPDGTIYYAGRALFGNSPPANSPWPKAYGRLDNRGRVPANPLFDIAATKLTSTGFNITLHTEPNERVALEWTSDWSIWNPLPTVTNLTGILQISDPIPTTSPFRIYRARAMR